MYSLNRQDSEFSNGRLTAFERGVPFHLPKSAWGFETAVDLPDVIAAWRLVYDTYRREGFIPSNRYRIHTTPEAVRWTTAVFYDSRGDDDASTVSAILDSDKGLPLDLVYRDKLDALRRQGRRLIEFGLLAHSGAMCSEAKHRVDPQQYPTIGRLADTLANVYRHAFCYSLQAGATDVVIGVHPKHALFYCRAAGFVRIAPRRVYHNLNDAQVVLLRCDLQRHRQAAKLPEGLAYCVDHPPIISAFRKRYRFDPSELRRSVIGQFLQEHYPNGN